MPQVDTVRIGDEYFRQYEIAPGDNLSTICFRYGHTNWVDVYNAPVNEPFRSEFHDRDLIHPGAVSLFIPLPGAPRSGRSVRGRPIEDYFAVNIVGTDGSPIQDRTFRLIGPGSTKSDVTTTSDGDILQSNPPAGDHTLVSLEFMLLEEGTSSGTIPPADIVSLPRRGTGSLPPIEVAPPLAVRHNVVMNVVARRMALIVCPTCGRTIRVVENASGATSACPHDGVALDPMLADVLANRPSFDAPATSADRLKPRHAPTTVLARGKRPAELTTAEPMTVYWDESRFARSDDGDYTLWGMRDDGTELTVSIVGRRTWGARPPELTELDENDLPRLYEFHEVRLEATFGYPYSWIAIPSNETFPLTDVLRWITVHHPKDPMAFGIAAVQEIETKHIEGHIVPPDPWLKDKRATVAYHFVIDGDGIVFEGRPLGIKGTHVDGFNGGNVGIVVSGEFSEPLEDGGDIPTEAQLQTLARLVEVLTLRFQGLRSVWGHRQREEQRGLTSADDVFTECPGARLIPYVSNELRPLYPGSGEPPAAPE
jgi:hypothetical protein